MKALLQVIMKPNFISEKFFKILVFSGIAILFTTVILFLWKETVFDTKSTINKEYFGYFGDFVSGIVGSLWALAGVILFYVALTEQRRDFQTNRKALENQIEALNLQSEEFKRQKNDMEEARRITYEQSKTLKMQQFESTFFSLLRVCSEIVQALDKKFDGDYFTKHTQLLAKNYKPGDEYCQCHKLAIRNYIEFYFTNKADLSHYFKTMYRIFKFIDDSSCEEKDKHLYAKIVRSQLKENEILLLFYNANTDYGSNFRPLILKYNLFKHLPPISKLEFINYRGKPKDKTEANKLMYCDWVAKYIFTFIQDMKINRTQLYEGNLINRSVAFNHLGALYELETENINQIKFNIYFQNNYDLITEFMHLNVDEFIGFNIYLLYDLLFSSLLKKVNNEITYSREENIIRFIISSDDGLDVCTDQF